MTDRSGDSVSLTECNHGPGLAQALIFGRLVSSRAAQAHWSWVTISSMATTFRPAVSGPTAVRRCHGICVSRYRPRTLWRGRVRQQPAGRLNRRKTEGSQEQLRRDRVVFLRPAGVRLAASIQPSVHGELEITDVNGRYLAEGQLEVGILGRGDAWLDTGTHDTLLEAGQFIATIEKRQGLKVACPEEIAYRAGSISGAELERLAKPMMSNGYGRYLMALLNDDTVYSATPRRSSHADTSCVLRPGIVVNMVVPRGDARAAEGRGMSALLPAPPGWRWPEPNRSGGQRRGGCRRRASLLRAVWERLLSRLVRLTEAIG